MELVERSSQLHPDVDTQSTHPQATVTMQVLARVEQKYSERGASQPHVNVKALEIVTEVLQPQSTGISVRCLVGHSE